MKVREALRQSRELLDAHRINDTTLETEILLRHVMHVDRVQFYQDLDGELPIEQAQAFRYLVNRYRRGEPIAYITGHREFFGLDFILDSRVLVPRPETEALVEKALSLAKEHHIQTIADVGTGCGAIAVSLTMNLPQTTVYALDSSADALEVARLNCEKHGVSQHVRLLQGNLLEPLPVSVDIITANLPYVQTADIPTAGPLSYEPRGALDGGEDGLDKFSEFIPQTKAKLNPHGCVLMEIGAGQSEAVLKLVRQSFLTASISVTRDLAGIERVVSFCI